MTFTVYSPTKRKVVARNAIPDVVPPLASLHEIVSKAAPFESGCGIYFLLKDSGSETTVVYIGQSVNVHARVATHVEEGKKLFDRWAWVECHQQQLDLLESLYIHWLRPSQQGRTTSRKGDDLYAPIAQRHLQHLLDALAPSKRWDKRKEAA